MNRIIFIGDPNVGKTTLLSRIINGNFDTHTKPTTAAAYFPYHPDPNDESFTVQFWDTAGTERYRSINRIYYRDAIAAILTFDFTSKKSFDDLAMWKNDFLNGESYPDAAIVLAGNKFDLVDKYEVNEEEAMNWANENGMQFFAVSAKTGESVDELVGAVIRSIPKKAAAKNANLLADGGCDDKDKKKCC